ncbi:180_t:CDS:2, partial [Gigaspora rosea]
TLLRLETINKEEKELVKLQNFAKKIMNFILQNLEKKQVNKIEESGETKDTKQPAGSANRNQRSKNQAGITKKHKRGAEESQYPQQYSLTPQESKMKKRKWNGENEAQDSGIGK